jgi:phenylalanyl-tRNA synthetase beta chain
MKFTLSWLKDHLETDASVDKIAETLTAVGLEIEGISDPGQGLGDFVVAHVVEAAQHPNADKLRVCVVDTGAGRMQVVCGAPNARAGMKGVFAAEGSYIHGTDMTLKPTSIRGVESRGMLLSEREMGLSDEHTGIVELNEDAPVGAPAVAVMGLDDPVIDVAITPNRGDCLGVRGIARDLAAAGLGTLKPLAAEPVVVSFDSPIAVSLQFSDETKDACPYFVGRAFRGLKNVESPAWLQRRLTAIGLRPISALVDITNYITYDLCRPLHVFDVAKVHGDIHVRLAREGEDLPALNGSTYEATPEMTVVCDDNGPEALGGVIGGERSGCTETTTDVFLEAALFDPVRTAATGRALNVQTDARYRFERGVDPEFLLTGAEVASRMILDLCGGEASNIVVAGAPPTSRPAISFRPERMATLVGADVPADDQAAILETLGFSVDRSTNPWAVTPATWRSDVVGEACLVEEVARIHGFDAIPAEPLPAPDGRQKPILTPAQQRRAAIKRVLAARGLAEAVTFSFVSSAEAIHFADVPDELKLVNPISAALDVMRPTLLIHLITAAARNADRGTPDAALFEVGPQYADPSPAGQSMVAAGVRSGLAVDRHWAQESRAVDAFDAKADALAALEALGAPVGSLSVGGGAPKWYHPGRSGSLQLGPKTTLAHFGELHPRVLRALDAKGPMVAFEVHLDHLPKAKKKTGSKPALRVSALQPVTRDFAFVVDRAVSAATVLGAVQKVDTSLITDVQIFDVFTGGNLASNEKSLALTVVLQPVDTTLTDADIERISQSIVDGVVSATSGRLRV